MATSEGTRMGNEVQGAVWIGATRVEYTLRFGASMHGSGLRHHEKVGRM